MIKKLELRYRTFDELLSDIMVDFSSYAVENMIEPQQLIKIAKRVNKDLGLKIYKTKEGIFELNHNKIKLPDDFYVFNHGFLCGEHTERVIMPQGITTEEVPYPRYRENASVIDTCADELCPVDIPIPACGGCGTCNQCLTDEIVVPGYNPLKPYGDICVKPRVFMDCKGGSWELIQIVHTQERHYKHFFPVKLVGSEGHFEHDCPNRHFICRDEVWIKNGFLHSNMRNGKIYISYEGNMEDEEGNLLVLDHDIINTYYEWALKTKIFENLWVLGEDLERKLLYAKEELRKARVEAWSIVRTPDFDEMFDNFKANRRRYNERYVNMFKDYNWYW